MKKLYKTVFESKMRDYWTEKQKIELQIQEKQKLKKTILDLQSENEKLSYNIREIDTQIGELPNQIEKLLTGVGRLCDCPEWRFKYWKDLEGHTFTKEAVSQFVPLTAEDYQTKVDSQTKTEVETVLDQGPTEVIGVDESKNITLRRPFSGDLKIKLEAIGQYDDIKQLLVGGLQLDESSNSQILYLEKYLGNYEIVKIDQKFLLKNKDKAIIFSKDTW
mgnify:CR=1 FL=1